MAQFDVFRNPKGGVYPLLLDVQSEALARVPSRVVVPLVTVKRYAARPITRLNPVVKVKAIEYVALFQMMASVPRDALGPAVGSLRGRRDDLVAAVDVLFTGI